MSQRSRKRSCAWPGPTAHLSVLALKTSILSHSVWTEWIRKTKSVTKRIIQSRIFLNFSHSFMHILQLFHYCISIPLKTGLLNIANPFKIFFLPLSKSLTRFCVCITESFCCVSETNITLLINYTPTENLKILNKEINDKIFKNCNKFWLGHSLLKKALGTFHLRVNSRALTTVCKDHAIQFLGSFSDFIPAAHSVLSSHAEPCISFKCSKPAGTFRALFNLTRRPYSSQSSPRKAFPDHVT